MRTKILVTALLASVALAPCAYAQLNKHDQSIAANNYNIAIVEDDSPASGAPLNQELDNGTISDNGVRTAPTMPAPMQGQAQAPLTPYQNIEPAAPSPSDTPSRSGAPMPMVAPAAQAIQVGATAPDFILPRTQGTAIGLKDILAKGPAVILFTRGSSCAFCVTQMQLLQKNQAQFNALGIQTVAVSPEALDGLARAQQRFGISYTLLSDFNSQVARTYGLASGNSAVPALVTIDATGKIVDVQTQQQGAVVFNLTQATNPLRGATAMVAPSAPARSPATAIPSTTVAPPAQQPAAMPPLPSPQAGKVKFDVPPSNPNFGKFDSAKSLSI